MAFRVSALALRRNSTALRSAMTRSLYENVRALRVSRLSAAYGASRKVTLVLSSEGSAYVRATLLRLRSVAERFEDVLGTVRSLRRVLRRVDIEPLSLEPGRSRGNGDDVVEAIVRATAPDRVNRTETGLTRRYMRRDAERHVAEPVWPLVETALQQLVCETSLGARSFSLVDIDEIGTSTSDDTTVTTVREAGDLASRHTACDTERRFAEALEASFPAGRPVRVEYRAWTGRHRWVPDEKSDRAAAAIRYAIRNGMTPRVVATLHHRSIDPDAVRLLTGSVRGFLLRDDRLDAYTYNRLSELELAFQLLTIRFGIRTRSILLVVPKTKRDRLAVERLTAKLPDPFGELSATLERAVAAHQS